MHLRSPELPFRWKALRKVPASAASLGPAKQVLLNGWAGPCPRHLGGWEGPRRVDPVPLQASRVTRCGMELREECEKC